MVTLFKLIAFLLVAWNQVRSFNIDSDANLLVYNLTSIAPDTTSSFGFALGFYNTSDSYKLIVGAPTFRNKTGSIFQCQTSSEQCSEVNIVNGDTSFPHNISESGFAEEFGRSITILDDRLTVCSPMWNLKNGINTHDYPVYGRCLTLYQNFTVRQIDAPCRTLNDGNGPVSSDRHAFCLTGLVNSYIKENDEYYMIPSNVGSWEYKGSIVVQHKGKRNSGFTNIKSQSTTLLSVGPSTTENSLLGYATATGHYHGEGKQGIAASAPMDNVLKGKVYVYEFTRKDGRDRYLNLSAIIENPVNKTGLLFGGSVISIDYNQDKLDDLVISDPLYSSGDDLDSYDVGKVYVYRNTQQGKVFIKEELELTGLGQKGSRFGTTITNIGDINRDGTDDLAVGAPFGGVDGQGVVFIYNVVNKKIQEKPSQIIYSPGGRGFGYSMVAKVIDTRLYPALAVGAPLSGQVYLFRARTVLTLKTNLWVNSPKVDPIRSNCRSPDGSQYHCITFGITIEDVSSNAPAVFDIQLNIQLDTSSTLGVRKRAYFLDTKSNSLVNNYATPLQIQRHQNTTFNTTVYFSIDRTTDFTSDIVMATSYTALQTDLNCDNNLCAVLDKFGDNVNSLNVSYLKQCGDDDICDVDLLIEDTRVEISGKENVPLLIGSSIDEIVVFASVKNDNESAYLAEMSINYGQDFDLIEILVNGISADFKKVEDANSTSSRSAVKFLLANPLSKNDSLNVAARFSLREEVTSLSSPNYLFDLAVTSTGRDYNTTNNNKTVIVPAGIESCLKIELQGLKEEDAPTIKYFENDNDDITVSYNFLIQNGGRLPLEDITATLNVVEKVQGTEFLTIKNLDGQNGATCVAIQDEELKLNGSNTAINGTRTLTNETETFPTNMTIAKNSKLKCNNGECKAYECRIENLSAGKLSGFRVTLDINMETLKMMQPANMEIEVNVGFNGQYASLIQQGLKCQDNLKVIQPFKKTIIAATKKSRVEWWILLLSVVSALILLAIFCALLYRVGFFKRQRVGESEPLESNKVTYIETLDDDE